jgi:hypothetical protein
LKAKDFDMPLTHLLCFIWNLDFTLGFNVELIEGGHKIIGGLYILFLLGPLMIESTLFTIELSMEQTMRCYSKFLSLLYNCVELHMGLNYTKDEVDSMKA